MRPLQRAAVLLGVGLLLLHVFVALRLLEGRHFAKYPQAARLLVAGDLPAERLADFSPAYLLAHAAATRFLPAPGAWVLAAQIVLTAGSALLLVALLLRFFSPTAAAAGVLIFAGCRGVAIHAGIFEPETALLFLVLAAATALARGGRGSPALAGAAAGLAVLLRPTALPLALLAPPLWWLAGRRGVPWRSASAQVLAGPLLATVLLAAVNARSGGGWSPAVMNPGDVLFEGNNPLSHGQSAVYPPLVDDIKLAAGEQPDRQHLSYRLVARRAAGRELSGREVNAYWADKVQAYARDYPWRAVRLAARKAYCFLHGFRFHDVSAAQRVEAALDRGRVPAVPFGLVAAMALPGMALMAARWRECWPAYAVLLVQAAVATIFYVSERQRLVAIPFFVFFATATLEALAAGGRRLLLLAAALPLALALQVPDDLMRDERHRWENASLAESMVGLARSLRDQGDFAQASGAASLALAATPLAADELRPAYVPFPGGYEARALARAGDPPATDAPARFDRALLLLETGKPAEADAVLADLEREGRRFNRFSEGSSEPAFHRARAALALGQRERAAADLRRALQRSPGEPFALSWLAAVTGDEDAGRRLARYFGAADAQFLLGRAHLDAGNAPAAVECFAYVAERFPEFRRGRIYLAAALAAANRPSEAVEAYQGADAVAAEPLMREGEILSAFRALAAQSPGDAAIAARYGAVLARFGRFREALEVERSARGPGAPPQLEAEIRWLEGALERAGG